jgi:hypothetical protein
MGDDTPETSCWRRKANHNAAWFMAWDFRVF